MGLADFFKKLGPSGIVEVFAGNEFLGRCQSVKHIFCYFFPVSVSHVTVDFHSRLFT